MKFLLRLAYVATTSMPFLLRLYYVLTTSWLSLVLTTLFEHVNNSTTSFKSMKTFLGSYYVLQVSTTLLLRPTSPYCVHLFFKDVVRTWLSVKGGIPFVIKIVVLSSYYRVYCTTFPTSFNKVVI